MFSVTVNFPVKNLELKDYIPLPKPKGNEKLRSKYDLIANIVHDGKPGEGCYRVFVQRKSEEAWYVFFISFLAMYSSDPQVRTW
jgi:U4/U6.U5 tri-snRNP-associated protein 2